MELKLKFKAEAQSTLTGTLTILIESDTGGDPEVTHFFVTVFSYLFLYICSNVIFSGNGHGTKARTARRRST